MAYNPQPVAPSLGTETMLERALIGVANFFEELLNVSHTQWSFANWIKSGQPMQESDRIIYALLIILLFQWNLLLAGRFLMFVLTSLCKVIKLVSRITLQLAAALIAFAAVLGSLRHPLTRLLGAIALFLFLRIHLSTTSSIALPAVVITLSIGEKYFPTLLDGKELVDIVEVKKSEMKELERRNSVVQEEKAKKTV